MKSLFIGILVLSVSLTTCAERGADTLPGRILQALAPLSQAQVQASIDASVAALVLTQTQILCVATSAQQIAAITSQALVDSTSQSVAQLLMPSIAQYYLVNTSILIAAQYSLISNQLNTAIGGYNQVVVDSFLALATATAVLQGVATTPSQWGAALTSTQQLLGAYISMNTQYNIAYTKSNTFYSTGVSSNWDQTNITLFEYYTLLRTSNANYAQVGSFFSDQIMNALVTAAANSALAVNVVTGLTAASTMGSALALIQAAASAIDSAQSTTVSNQLQAIATSNLDYGNYQNALMQLNNVDIYVAQLGNQVMAEQLQSTAQQYQLTDSATSMFNLANSANNLASLAQTITSFDSQQRDYQLANAILDVQTTTATQLKACKALAAGASKSDKASRIVTCATANVALQSAVAAQAFISSN